MKYGKTASSPAATGGCPLINLDRRGHDLGLAVFGGLVVVALLEGGDEVVVEDDGEFPGRDFYVDGVCDEIAETIVTAGLLGNGLVSDVIPDIMASSGIEAGGGFPGFAETGDDFLGGHIDGGFLLGDEGFDFLLALRGALEIRNEIRLEGAEVFGFHPTGDLTLLGLSFHAEGGIGEGLQLDELAFFQDAKVAAEIEIEINGRLLDDVDFDGFRKEILEVDDAGFAEDGPGLQSHGKRSKRCKKSDLEAERGHGGNLIPVWQSERKFWHWGRGRYDLCSIFS